MSLRRSYVALAAMCVAAPAIAVVWCSLIARHESAQDAQTRRDLCGVIAPFAQTPATGAASLAYHRRFAALSREFGCSRP